VLPLRRSRLLLGLWSLRWSMLSVVVAEEFDPMVRSQRPRNPKRLFPEQGSERREARAQLEVGALKSANSSRSDPCYRQSSSSRQPSFRDCRVLLYPPGANCLKGQIKYR